jgi:hypothetical protein
VAFCRTRLFSCLLSVGTGKLNGRRMKMTTHLHSVSLLRACGTYRPSVLNWSKHGKSFIFCTEVVDQEESELPQNISLDLCRIQLLCSSCWKDSITRSSILDTEVNISFAVQNVSWKVHSYYLIIRFLFMKPENSLPHSKKLILSHTNPPSA